MINTVLIAVSVVVFLITLFVMYQRAKMKTTIEIEDDYSTIEKVLEGAKTEMVEITKEDYSLGLSEAEFSALYKRKVRIQDALKTCVHGIEGAKVIVIGLLREFIKKEVPLEKVTELLGLSDGMEPSDHVKFEILLYRYKKTHKKKALEEIILKYNLARERRGEGAESNQLSYFVSIEDLHTIYEEEEIYLSDDEKYDLLAILVYQLYKGFGILDTLREMDINGFNCGTSGSIMHNVQKHRDGALKATNSVWLYFRGKYIHLRFMSFGSEDELRRIIQLMIRYNNPGPLTAKRGYLVNTMYDKSRILALRPPVSEYWAVFVRKFTISDPTPEALVIRPFTKNGQLPIKLTEFLIRGMVTCAVTGRQGSGKTTWMSSIIRYIDHRFTLRVLEMAPELYLREIYPSRNILSAQETDTVSATEVQDAFKKSDAAVSIVGEVATDAVAARMIQMGMTASMFTIFSHHGNTPEKLIYTLRNSLANAGGFNNMATAEQQVLEVVKMDIHWEYTADGERYIERISEIIPLPENVPYPEIDPNELEYSRAKIEREYYSRLTDRVSFITKDIIRYDLKTTTYYAVNRLSPELERYIRMNLGEHCHEFDKFTLANWGKRKNLEEGQVDDVVASMLTHYEGQVEVAQPTSASNFSEGLSIFEPTEEEKLEAVVNKIKSETKDLEYKPLTAEEEFQLEQEIENNEEAYMVFDFFDGGVKV